MEKIYKLEKIPKSNKKTLNLVAKFQQEKELQEIVIGKILGDGSITKTGNLNFYHGAKQKEYIEHCYALFFNFTKQKGVIATPRLRKQDGKKHDCLYFETCAIFKEYMPLFYKYEENTNQRIKIIPNNLENLLTARSLAYWIMDDGAKTGKNLILCTHSFSLEENKFLIKILETKFALNCKLQTQKKPNSKEKEVWFYIQINNVDYLWNLVKEYIHPSMQYKFGKYCNPTPIITTL